MQAKAHSTTILTQHTQNVSIPWRNSMPASGGMAPSIVAAFYNDMLLCRNGSYPALGDTGRTIHLLRSKPQCIQRRNWPSPMDETPLTPPAGNITTISFAGADAQAGYFCESYRQTQQFVGFNLRTGEKLWISDPQPALDYYGSTGPRYTIKRSSLRPHLQQRILRHTPLL